MRNLIVIMPSTISNSECCDGLGMLAIMLAFIIIGLFVLIVCNIYFALKSQGDKYLFKLFKQDSIIIIVGRALVILPLFMLLVLFIAAFIYSLII